MSFSKFVENQKMQTDIPISDVNNMNIEIFPMKMIIPI